ncbi:TadE family protein [Marilutibacter alkalisoli]|uniref:Pilus assembly protein n=1 Tax=Marilutibacter alkalisoli TaxID=2591633 RepID=A0A514BW31_9GAMM|nr:TadE family protein [Lysobacter alkalisoli]QDH71596.1 pilus assembly protein [Lysobacter alkalisoli]
MGNAISFRQPALSGVKSPRLQHGQALTEMAILAVVLVPLFLLIPMLGKYSHTQQMAQQAVRAAAWEATVADSYHWDDSVESNAWRAQQLQKLIDRHYGDAAAPIRSQSSGAQGSDAVEDVMMNTFSGRPLLQRDGVELLPYKNESAGFSSKAIELLDKLPDFIPGDFPPGRDGLVSAELVVRPEDLKTADGAAAKYLEPFDNLGLEMRVKHVVLADTWNASGSGCLGGQCQDSVSAQRDRRRVRDQVKTLSLGSIFGPDSRIGGPIHKVKEALKPFENIPLLDVPLRIDPGYIEPDVVPRDRLQAYQP